MSAILHEFFAAEHVTRHFADFLYEHREFLEIAEPRAIRTRRGKLPGVAEGILSDTFCPNLLKDVQHDELIKPPDRRTRP